MSDYNADNNPELKDLDSFTPLETETSDIEKTSYTSKIDEENKYSKEYFSHYDAVTTDPFTAARYLAAKTDLLEAGRGTYFKEHQLNVRENNRDLESRTIKMSAPAYLGAQLYANSEVYNRLNRGLSADSSGLSGYQSRNYQQPKGLIQRPTNKTYLAAYENYLGQGSSGEVRARGAYFQFHEESLVSDLLQRSNQVELVLQGVSDYDDADGIKLVGANEVVKEAFKQKEMLAGGSSQVVTVEMKDGAEDKNSGVFHPKVMYFAKGQEAFAAIVGSQNVTAALSRNNTVEEALFLKLRDDLVSPITQSRSEYAAEQSYNEAYKLVQTAPRDSYTVEDLEGLQVIAEVKYDLLQQERESGLSLLSQVQAVTDIFYDVAETGQLKGADYRDEVNKRYKNLSLVEDHRRVLINQDIHNVIREKLTSITSKAGSKAVLNIQYLEKIFKPSNSNDMKNGTNAERVSFIEHRRGMLEAMKTLAESGRLTVMTSETSINSKQGLFATLAAMSKIDRGQLSEDDKLGYDTFKALVASDSFRLMPSQLMHSKSAVFLDAEGNIDETIIGSANYSFNSYASNIEMAVRMNQTERSALGVDDEQLKAYLKATTENSIVNGLFVERQGDEAMTRNTIAMLRGMGGVNARDTKADMAPFTFSERFTKRKTGETTSLELSGLDIQINGLNPGAKDKWTFSITVGAINRYEYNPELGRSEQKVTPIIYLNKGNRMITGAFYKYKGTKSLEVTAGNRIVLPGESFRIDAQEMLAGMIQTMQLSFKFEREQRSLFKALGHLDQISSLETAFNRLSYYNKEVDGEKIDREFFTEESKASKIEELRHLLETHNLEGIKAQEKLIHQLLKTSYAASEFFDRTLNEAKKEIFNQLIDVHPQTHEGYYSHNQQLENIALYGAEESTLSLLVENYHKPLGESSLENIKLNALVLSQIDLRHEDALDNNGLPIIRSVGAVSNLERVDSIDLVGGLQKSRDGSPKITDLNIMNSITGLRMFSAGEYREKLKKSYEAQGITEDVLAAQLGLADDDDGQGELLHKLIESNVKKVFAAKLLESSKEQDSRYLQEEIKDDAVILFFPYEKTEQISQRLKNLFSMRPLRYGNKELTRYLRTMGYSRGGADYEVTGDSISRETIASAIPSAQFAELNRRLNAINQGVTDENQRRINQAKVLNQLRSESLNADKPDNGYLGEEQLMLVSMGATPMSDFTYINAAKAKDGGFISMHRTQQAMNAVELTSSVGDFIQVLSEKLKPGTLMVARNIEVKATGAQQGLHSFVTNKVNEQLLELGEEQRRTIEERTNREAARATEISENSTLSDLDLDVLRATYGGSYDAFSDVSSSAEAPAKVLTVENATTAQLKEATNRLKSQTGMEWLSNFQFVKEGRYNLQVKKGVYKPHQREGGYALEKIGDIEEGDSTFYLYDVTTSKITSTSRAVQYMRFRAPAFARREYNGISIVTETSVGVVDRQPGMLSVNIEYLTDQDLMSGLRTANVKGPMLSYQEKYFQYLEGLLSAERQEDSSQLNLLNSQQSTDQTISSSEVFGVISSGQIKGFVFNIGYSLLADYGASPIYQLLKQADGRSVSEGGSNATAEQKRNIGYKVAEALALMMLGTERVETNLAGETQKVKVVQEALKSAYSSGLIEGRTQFRQTLELVNVLSNQGRVKGLSGKLPMRGDTNTIEGALKSTIGIYEELLGLVNPAELVMTQGNELRYGNESGLVETVLKTLTGASSDDYAAQLGEAAFRMVNLTINEYSQEVIGPEGNKKITFDEQKGRSAALLSFFLKAAEDLIADINPNATGARTAWGAGGNALTELGFKSQNDLDALVNALADSESTNEIREGVINALAAQAAAMNRDVEEVKTLVDALQASNLEGVKDQLRANGYDLSGFESTVEQYLQDENIERRYDEAGRSLRIQLPSAAEVLDALGGRRERLTEELELGLYKIYSLGQYNRYMQVKVDPMVRANTPAVGMQDSTNLEGHYASKLSKSHLDLYTVDPKDKAAYSSIQETLITVGAMIEEQFGYLNLEKVRSRYTFSHTNVLDLGLATDEKYQLTGDGLNLSEERITAESNRVNAMRLVLDFSQAYSHTTSKTLPRILGRTETSLGGVQSSPPSYSLFRKFTDAATNFDETTKADVTEALNYMLDVKEISREIIRIDQLRQDDNGEDTLKDSTLEYRVDQLVDDYFQRLKTSDNRTGSLFVKEHAKFLVSDLIKLVQIGQMNSIVNESAQVADSQDTKIRDLIVSYLENSEPGVTDKEALKEQIVTALEASKSGKSAGQVEVITSMVNTLQNQNEVAAIKELESLINVGQKTDEDLNRLKSLDTLERKKELKGKSNQERKELLASALANKYGADLVNWQSATATEVLNTVVEDEVIVDILKSVVGKDFRDRVKSNISLDPGKEYLLGRQELRKYVSTELEELKTLPGITEAESNRVKFLEQVELNLGRTQVIDIPKLNFGGGSDSQGNFLAYVMPETKESSEQGWLLGLDILERVALVFPEYSSEALIAQHQFAEKLQTAQSQGVLEKITQGLLDENTTGEIALTQAEVVIYEDLRKAARNARVTALAITDNEKITRNALGDQLTMKGASYIGMSSFLLAPSELAMGKRFFNLVDAGSANLSGLLTSLAEQFDSADSRGKDQALSSLNELGKTLGENFIGFESAEQFQTEVQRVKDKGVTDSVEVVKAALGLENIGTQELEKRLYVSNVIAARQGAPGGVGATFDIGNDVLTMSEFNERARNAGSLMTLDDETNKTVMLMSVMGGHFTNLGDYDGDSFQAAITRMAQVSAELASSYEELAIAKKLKAELDLAQQENNNLSDRSVEQYSQSRINESQARIRRAADLFVEKLQTMQQLQSRAKDAAASRLRLYGEQLLGLPASVFEGSDRGGIGAIKDSEINSTVKQFRDTISGHYDNSEHINNWLTPTLAKLQSVTQAGDDITFALKDGQTLSVGDQEALTEFVRAYNTSGTEFNTQFTALTNGSELSLESKKRLVEFGSMVEQQGIAIKGLDKFIAKAAGNSILPETFSEVQAIIGSTGTGLLGKTYNTIIPLLSMVAGEQAFSRAIDNETSGIKDLLGQALDLRRTQVSGDSTRLDFINALRSRYTQRSSNVTMKAMEADMKGRINTMMGLLMDTQQFLRDAALKPKEGTSVAAYAARFTLQGIDPAEGDYAWATDKKGLNELLSNAKDDQQRTYIMSQFIGHEAGFVLSEDFGMNSEEYKNKRRHKGLDNNELRAFSALTMMNEYLSGKYSASEMMEKSTFAGFLKRRKDDVNKYRQEQREQLVIDLQATSEEYQAEELQKFDLLNPEKTDKEVVEEVIFDSTARFRSRFIYDSVLEGDKNEGLLAEFSNRMLEGYDIAWDETQDSYVSQLEEDQAERLDLIQQIKDREDISTKAAVDMFLAENPSAQLDNTVTDSVIGSRAEDYSNYLISETMQENQPNRLAPDKLEIEKTKASAAAAREVESRWAPVLNAVEDGLSRSLRSITAQEIAETKNINETLKPWENILAQDKEYGKVVWQGDEAIDAFKTKYNVQDVGELSNPLINLREDASALFEWMTSLDTEIETLKNIKFTKQKDFEARAFEGRQLRRQQGQVIKLQKDRLDALHSKDLPVNPGEGITTYKGGVEIPYADIRNMFSEEQRRWDQYNLLKAEANITRENIKEQIEELKSLERTTLKEAKRNLRYYKLDEPLFSGDRQEEFNRRVEKLNIAWEKGGELNETRRPLTLRVNGQPMQRMQVFEDLLRQVSTNTGRQRLVAIQNARQNPHVAGEVLNALINNITTPLASGDIQASEEAKFRLAQSLLVDYDLEREKLNRHYVAADMIREDMLGEEHYNKKQSLYDSLISISDTLARTRNFIKQPRNEMVAQARAAKLDAQVQKGILIDHLEGLEELKLQELQLDEARLQNRDDQKNALAAHLKDTNALRGITRDTIEIGIEELRTEKESISQRARLQREAAELTAQQQRESIAQQMVQETTNLTASKVADLNKRQGQPLLITDTQLNDINREVTRFKVEEREIQKSILAALQNETAAKRTRENNETARLTEIEQGKVVMKAAISHNISKQFEHLKGRGGQAGIADTLISINKTIADIRSGGAGVITANETQGMLDITETALLSMLRRGKAAPGAIAEITKVMTDLSKALRSGGDTSAKTAALMSTAGLQLPEVKELIEQKASENAFNALSIESQEIIQEKQQQGLSVDKAVATLAESEKSLYEKTKEKSKEAYGRELTEVFFTEVTDKNGKKSTLIESIGKNITDIASAMETGSMIDKLTADHAQAVIEGNVGNQEILKTMIDTLTVNQGKDPATAYSALNNAMNQYQSKATENYRASMREMAKEVVQGQQKKAKKDHGVGGVLSLFAVPALFGVIQGDVTMNDRVASVISDVVQSAVTATSYEGSALRNAFYGKTAAESTTRAQQKSANAAVQLQLGRITETMRRTYSQAEGLAKGVAFEMMFTASSRAAGALSERMFKNNATAQGVAEVIGGMAGMAVSNVVTERPRPGSFVTYDNEWAFTMKILKNIANNILESAQQLLQAQADEDMVVVDELTGGSIEAALEGDFTPPMDNTTMNAVERMWTLGEVGFVENTIGGEEYIAVI